MEYVTELITPNPHTGHVDHFRTVDMLLGYGIPKQFTSTGRKEQCSDCGKYKNAMFSRGFDRF